MNKLIAILFSVVFVIGCTESPEADFDASDNAAKWDQTAKDLGIQRGEITNFVGDLMVSCGPWVDEHGIAKSRCEARNLGSRSVDMTTYKVRIIGDRNVLLEDSLFYLAAKLNPGESGVATISYRGHFSEINRATIVKK